MKKTIAIICCGLLAILNGCSKDESVNTIKFATNADYPPFEYQEKNELKGFDIELAQLIAKKLGKIITFENIQFATIFPALENNFVDAAIATIGITEERLKTYDFSIPYYVSNMVAISSKNKPVVNKEQLINKKIGCQLGTTMEHWVKKQHFSNSEIISMDSNNQVIEALKSEHIDVALMDETQAAVYCQKFPALNYTPIARLDNGYGIALKKGSPFKKPIDDAISALIQEGEIKKLQLKWLKVQQ